MKYLKVPKKYLDGEWYNAGEGMACKSVQEGDQFVFIRGYLVYTDDPDELDLIPLSIDHYPIQ